MKFTIITSVFNQVKYLDFIQDALKKQTFKDFEWIIADDGSEDNPREWAEEHKIKFVTQEKKGMRLARILNKAIAIAKGDYIITIMGDSVPDERLLEEYQKVMADGVVGNGLRVFVKDSMPVGKIKNQSNFIEDDWRKNALQTIGERNKPWRVFTGNNICISAIDYGRLKQTFGFCWNEDYEGYGLEDFDLASRLWELKCEFVPVPTALVYHISHPKPAESESNQLLYWKRMKELEGKYQIGKDQDET